VKFFRDVTTSSDMQTLLTSLAAGADQPLFTVESWVQRLGESEAARQFVGQLQTEWYPLVVPNAFCQEMMDYVRTYVGSHLGWAHLWAHTLRVTGAALALAENAQIEPEFAFLLGMFHDIGKLDEIVHREDHEAIGARLLRKKLDGIYSKSIVTMLAAIVAKTASPANPFRNLLHDADKLDKIGATGIARRLSTAWGAEHITLAMRRVKREAEEFPAMHYPASRRLAESKLAFTASFFDQLNF
jgi:HD superfamily phosphodiesterase